MHTDPGVVRAARLLAIDSVEAAGSGHPGTAIALAPVATTLFQNHIRHNPADPAWRGRDRFVLSCGHASILLYTQLFLTGYGLQPEDLQAFRSLGSLTPGHPEYGHTVGVETTTGPLGQGLATAVGMAMAMKHERGLYDPGAPAGESVFDRTVWVLASDGDLQEGISYEAGALAGRHKLDNLVVVYDDNDIQIEGSTSLTSSEDVAARFAAQGWEVSRVELATDGDVDVDALNAELARPRDGKPRLVVLKSQIAWPAPHATGTAASHGAPLGQTEADATRAVLGAQGEPFDVDPEALATARNALSRGATLQGAWLQRYTEWASANPAAAHAWEVVDELPSDLDKLLPQFAPGDRLATRDASGRVIQALADAIPALWGGSADLAEPNRTAIGGGGSFLPEEGENSGRAGRNIHFGVREHAMAATMNGIALVTHAPIFAGTFLVFSDYQRPAIRLASLMRLPVIYLWSHDSVALGADGPTHQPIEHLASLRAIPGFTVIRPADAQETVAAWLLALELRSPVGLVLARQPLPVADTPSQVVLEGVRRGAYAVRDVADPAVTVVATGSEVALALEAAALASEDGIATRVISMPSREIFARQEPEYREAVLPADGSIRVVVEAATRMGWHDVAGPDGFIVGIDEFGVSAPADDALRSRGITSDNVLSHIRQAALSRA